MKNPMYDKHAKAYAEAVKANLYNALYERPALIKLIPPMEAATAMDLGCGPGEHTQYLLESLKAQVTAVDISEQMIQIMSDRFGDDITCYQQDFNEGLPKEKDATFDLVISALTIHYIEHLDTLIQSVYRVLKPGGYFVFSTHHPCLDLSQSQTENYFALESLTQTWKTTGEPVEVTFLRRPLESIINSLISAGFNITTLSEGKPDESIRSNSIEHFEHLLSHPHFLFIQCVKSER